MPEEIDALDPQVEALLRDKEGGYNYRQRRHSAWDEIYEFYRDKVTINRLTQRQSVNLPMMKLVIQTLLKDIDDMPVLYFENLDNNKEAETFKNEYWKWTDEQNSMEIQDIVDKKQVGLFGRSFDQWQIIDGRIVMEVQDVMDIYLERYTNPFNIHSSRFLIHTHIFKPLSYLEKNPDYDQEAVRRLKEWHATDQGLIKAASNERQLIDKNKKMADLGVLDIESPILGETYVEITLHFKFLEEDGKPDQIYLFVQVDDREILLKKPLEEIIGVTKDHYFQDHYPYVSWASDIERQDVWSDGIGDTVRTPNKILNSWFSQEVERRTLSNFGMNYYDSSLEGFQPQTWEAIPWGWYGLPVPPGKNLGDVFKKVDIPANDGNLESMNFIIEFVQKATGATPTQQGVTEQRQITLGEVQLALGEAKERIKGMSKFYTQAWKDRGTMFIKLVEAAADKLDAVKVYKEGRNTSDIYEREIKPSDWMTKAGYRCKVWSQEEKNNQDTESLQKLNAAKMNMPDNPKLDEIYKRKLIEYAKLTPDEINQIMEFEDQKRQALTSAIMNPMQGQPILSTQPQLPNPNQNRPALNTQPR